MKRLVVANVFLVLLVTSAVSGPHTPPRYDFSSVRHRLDAECESGFFSGVVVVRAHGREVFSHVCGIANAETGLPMARTTRFRIFSTSKLMTALAVMRLVELGKMRLDESIAAYVPDVPAEWHAVTVRHLLQHTSGLPDDSEKLLDAWRTDHPTAMRVVLDEERRLRAAPATAPGVAWNYNNFNYELLADGGARVTGRPFQEVLRQLVFAPSSMRTAIVEQPALKNGIVVPESDPLLAQGYNGEPGNVVPVNPSSFVQLGAGAIHATVEDFVALDEALSSGPVISKTSYREMKSSLRSHEANDPSHGYGLGLIVHTIDGVRCEGHDGGNNGYVSDFERFPDDEAMMIMLANRGFTKLWLRDSVATVLKEGRGT